MRGMKFSPVLAAIALFPLFTAQTRGAGRSIYPIKEGYIDANGALIYYTEFG
jgi:hypothetical protein